MKLPFSLPRFRRARDLVGWAFFGLLAGAAALAGVIFGLVLVYSTDLPQVSELEHYRPSAITELYDDKGSVIGTFALQRRVVITYDEFPKVLREAIISIEDKDFEKHWGINLWRAAGAAYRDMVSARKVQGASTLTMQLSRNLFLSPDRNFARKIQEIMLAIQIERRFTKPQIFTLYGNQIYLGHGVYGFEAGSEYYFSKRAEDLTLPEAATLAALPKSPGQYSPITNPERSIRRRNLVIDAMLEDGKITSDEAIIAKNSPLQLNVQRTLNSIAPYFVEEIRQYLERTYGSEEVHRGGLLVYTTLNTEMQRAANHAVLNGLATYEHRHGWQGRLKNILSTGQSLEKYEHPDWSAGLETGGYSHVLVTSVSATGATVKMGRYQAVIHEPGWVKRPLKSILRSGDIAYVKIVKLGSPPNAEVALEQDSGAQGSLMAMDNATGDVKAMVGGRDFEESKFNRATQAMRQVGSAFKPFVYTAAVDEGALPDDIIVDAPTTFISGGHPYSPHDYDNRFEGAITLRRALAQSRNVPAVKLAERVGIRRVIDMTHKFGITSNIPPYLPIALGSAEVSLYEATAAYDVFPNDGMRIAPRYLVKVTDRDGHVREENLSEVKDVVRPRTARIMVELMKGVVKSGTATKALALNHALAGKTGTTNDFTDAWFIGFSPSMTCGVWVGFDEKKTLGKRETGGLTALPLWIDFMKVALAKRDPKEDFAPLPPLPARAVAVSAPVVDTPDETPADSESH